jgi:hypothetical protein
MWEENMRSVVSSQAELEQQLATTQQQATRRKKALRELKSSVLADTASPGKSPVAISETRAGAAGGAALAKAAPAGVTKSQDFGADVSDSSEDEDNFYDAVESGAVPVRVETPLQAPDEQDFPKDFEMTDERMLEIQSYEGYKHLRDRLPITADERPPVSLWAILKGSIGKDLTKISFPVYFNGESLTYSNVAT